MFIITTDGQENSSTQFRYADVKKMIEAAKEKGWEFLYLGANIDAAAEAAKIGISRERAANYEASACGTRSLFKAMNSSVASVRRKGVMSDAWKDALK